MVSALNDQIHESQVYKTSIPIQIFQNRILRIFKSNLEIHRLLLISYTYFITSA